MVKQHRHNNAGPSEGICGPITDIDRQIPNACWGFSAPTTSFTRRHLRLRFIPTLQTYTQYHAARRPVAFNFVSKFAIRGLVLKFSKFWKMQLYDSNMFGKSHTWHSFQSGPQRNLYRHWTLLRPGSYIGQNYANVFNAEKIQLSWNISNLCWFYLSRNEHLEAYKVFSPLSMHAM